MHVYGQPLRAKGSARQRGICSRSIVVWETGCRVCMTDCQGGTGTPQSQEPMPLDAAVPLRSGAAFDLGHAWTAIESKSDLFMPPYLARAR